MPRLAARGAHVFGTVRDDEGAAAFAEATGGSGTAIRADVTDEAAGAAIAAALAARDQPLDLLVNNAGVMTTGARIEEVRIADVDHLLRVHVHGPIRCTQAALPWLRRSPNGAIVNVTSRLGSIARVAGGAYDHLRILLRHADQQGGAKHADRLPAPRARGRRHRGLRRPPGAPAHADGKC